MTSTTTSTTTTTTQPPNIRTSPSNPFQTLKLESPRQSTPGSRDTIPVVRRLVCRRSPLIMASFPNIYTHRKVADTAAKPCTICYKPSSSVMVTAENKVKNICCLAKLLVTSFPGLLLRLSKPSQGQAVRNTNRG